MKNYIEFYNKDYYEGYGSKGEKYGHHEPWLSHFKKVAEEIVSRYHPRTHVDAGCAIGVLVNAMREQGVTSYGVDFSPYAISQANPAWCFQGNLVTLDIILERETGLSFLQKENPKVDLITCIEVLEHMPADEAEIALGAICYLSDRVIFSSTSDDKEDPTHINVRSQEDWISSFERHGFSLIADAPYISPWAKVFEYTDHG